MKHGTDPRNMYERKRDGGPAPMVPTAHELYAPNSNSREYLATARNKWQPDCLPLCARHLCSHA